jgi:hypothetical protein
LVSLRRVISIGKAKGITFPSGWLRAQEKTYGPIKEVLLREAGNVLVVILLDPKENAKHES